MQCNYVEEDKTQELIKEHDRVLSLLYKKLNNGEKHLLGRLVEIELELERRSNA
jgi:hypothetical protein